MDEELNDQAPAAPEADSGDFGDGTGSLEERLLDSIKDEPEVMEDTGEGEAGAVDEKTAGEVPASAGESKPAQTQALFDLNGKLTLKTGEKLSAEHVRELERGWLREADYTKKTQELSKIRNEANRIVNAQKEIEADPRNLFQYIPAQKILSAFTRQEMLAHGLHAAGVSPQVWNQFLSYLKETGGQSAAEQAPQADQYSQQFGEFGRRLEANEKRITTWEQQQQQSAQERAYHAQKTAYDKEVDSAVKQYPEVKKRDLLVEMAASDGSRTILQIAADLNKALEARFQDYLKIKQQQKKSTVKAPKGTAVPVMRKKPQTFEEADELVAQMYGAGSLQGSEPFGS